VNQREIAEQKSRYETSGFVIERGAIDSDLAGEMAEHVHWLEQRYPDIRPEILQHFDRANHMSFRGCEVFA
jgi:phytanoyl-CoA hydroxylase